MELIMKNIYKLSYVLVFLLTVLSAPVGCSRSSSKTETTTVSDSPSGPVETSKTTTTESHSSSDGGCGGILSCTFDTLGTIIAFPFRVVGSVFEAIF
jgi:hypothetical protein